MKSEGFAIAHGAKKILGRVRVMCTWLCTAFFVLHSLFFLSGCARMGSPDGGWYDDTPPRVIGATPEDKGVNVKSKKISIYFNEFIKIEDAQNKVIVSPPQIEQAEIKAAGKRIVIEIKDSLKENTTYTVDFSDAITDNNEGNPMGNYTYSFSTYDQIDTLEVSGYCLNAENLEPIKGILVGLYDDFTDSLFHTKPMIRVSRTNGSGRFTIKGVGKGTYRIFALQDADGDYVFGQKSEMIGFSHDSIKPTWKPDTRQDTIWRDTLHIENILRIGYTHFLPDDVTLLCFQEPQTDRSLLKIERKEPERIDLYFTYGSDSLPTFRGLNFDSDNAFVVEASEKKDTLFYWLKDTTLVNTDTLEIEMKYLVTDTLGQLVEQVDTQFVTPKVPYEKRLKEKNKELEKWTKEQNKKKKRGEKYDSIMPIEHLKLKMNVGAQMAPNQVLRIEMPEPLAYCDTSAVHLFHKVDSLMHPYPVEMIQTGARTYMLNATWTSGEEYSLEIDSAAFAGIYGLVSNKIKQGITVKKAEEFSTLTVTLSGIPQPLDSAAVVVVQLLDNSDKVKREEKADASGKVSFQWLEPGKYYLRAYVDMNGNGQWDTGLYDQDLQAEPVFYHHEEVECKVKWDTTRRWNLTAVPRYRQKPMAITKQKPDKEKQQKNRNLERAKQLGKAYLKDNGVNL